MILSEQELSTRKATGHKVLEAICNKHQKRKKVIYAMVCKDMKDKRCHFADCESVEQVNKLIKKLIKLDEYLTNKKFIKVDPEVIRKNAQINAMRKLSPLGKLWFRIKNVL